MRDLEYFKLLTVTIYKPTISTYLAKDSIKLCPEVRPKKHEVTCKNYHWLIVLSNNASLLEPAMTLSASREMAQMRTLE